MEIDRWSGRYKVQVTSRGIRSLIQLVWRYRASDLTFIPAEISSDVMFEVT